jgi:hypothetical protein
MLTWVLSPFPPFSSVSHTFCWSLSKTHPAKITQISSTADLNIRCHLHGTQYVCLSYCHSAGQEIPQPLWTRRITTVFRGTRPRPWLTLRNSVEFNFYAHPQAAEPSTVFCRRLAYSVHPQLPPISTGHIFNPSTRWNFKFSRRRLSTWLSAGMLNLGLVEFYRRFRDCCCLHHYGDEYKLTSLRASEILSPWKEHPERFETGLGVFQSRKGHGDKNKIFPFRKTSSCHAARTSHFILTLVTNSKLFLDWSCYIRISFRLAFKSDFCESIIIHY